MVIYLLLFHCVWQGFSFSCICYYSTFTVVYFVYKSADIFNHKFIRNKIEPQHPSMFISDSIGEIRIMFPSHGKVCLPVFDFQQQIVIVFLMTKE